MRQIVLDTETTGLETRDGHRVIEIGCVELVDRRFSNNHYHVYLNPKREMDAGAVEVHGITQEFLADKPVFSQEVDAFINFVKGAELVIHNAPFDVGFLNAELERLGSGYKPIEHYCTILDTLKLARTKHPGQRNSLDALCKRYQIDNSHRELHGALLDSEILADVYLRMTGGQIALMFGEDEQASKNSEKVILQTGVNRSHQLKVIMCGDEEIALHKAKLEIIDQRSGGGCIWKNMDNMK